MQRLSKARISAPLVLVGLIGAVVLLGAEARSPALEHPAVPGQSVGTADRIDGDRLLRHLSALAHDSMQGRRTGTPGNERARRYLLRAFETRLAAVNGSREHAFQFVSRRDSVAYEGLNIMGMIQGSEQPERYIVVTAHYDHLGVQGGEVYNGADDNASGTSALLELADWFGRNRPSHSIVFVALDAEEMGLQGARAWVESPPVPLDHVVMNVNLDMISRSEAGELYAAGTYHSPFLTPLVEEVAAEAPVTLLRGHDSPDLPPGDDWTMASDHGPFHEKGLPFIYFGVEDHPGYHNPTDTFENITPEFYVRAVETILDFLLVADREGEMIMSEREAVSVGIR